MLNALGIMSTDKILERKYDNTGEMHGKLCKHGKCDNKTVMKF